jgi:hypothetical protein
MPQVDLFKLSNIESVREIAKHITEKNDITEFDFTKILMGHARLNKRNKESDGAALERIRLRRKTASCGRPIGLQKEWRRSNQPAPLSVIPIQLTIQPKQ